MRLRYKKMAQTEDILGQIPLFHGLTNAQLKEISIITQQKRYPKGQVIIQEGDPADTMYILIDGSVEVSRTVTLNVSQGKLGEAEKSFGVLEAKDYPCFGEMALLEKSLRGATVTALVDCQLLGISGETFDAVCNKDPILGYIVTKNMARQLSARLRSTNQDVLKLTTALSLALSRR